MKIAVATNDFKTVAGHVGKCKGFIIYEIDESGKIIVKKNVENTFTNHAQNHEHHHHEHHHGEGHGVDKHNRIAEGIEFSNYLICRAAGPGLINSLAAFNIQTVFTKINSADDSVELLIKKALPIDESECDKEG